MSALDELLRSWRANPDASATVALCTALGRAHRPDLMAEVRGVAEQWHLGDAQVMLAVGTMFLEAGSLVEAQAAFVSAGKADGRLPAAFRFLGEVLLRRGDAVRAEKVFERALRLDAQNADLRLWNERARMFVPLQSRVGMEAVSAEVARTVPRTFSDMPSPLKTDPAPPLLAASPPPLPVAVRPAAAQPTATLGPSGPPSLAPQGGWVAPTQTPAPTFGVLADSSEPASAQRILAELARVGVFEEREGGAPSWEKAPREKNRSLWVLAAAALIVGASAVGATQYARSVAQQKVVDAAELCEDVSRKLRIGTAQAIAGTDEQLSRAFELDPNSTRAARLWLENRVLHWLVRGTSEGIEGAIQRMRRLGASPEEVAFGTLAVRLADGDVPGALGVLPGADEKAKGDVLYQLFAGLALERVGDVSCLQRYETAVTTDGELRVARVLRARALLSMQGAGALSRALEGLDAASVEHQALSLLSAAIAPLGEDAGAETENAKEVLSAENLPVFLRWIPGLWRARQALAAGEREPGIKLLGEALATVDTPDGAVRLGELALAADSSALVRQAALQAISLSPVHGPARLLAARAAADMGRYDEVQKALEGLETKNAEALGLRAVVAYERGDAVALGDAVDALKGEAPPVLAALPALLVGGALPKELAPGAAERPETLWGRVALVDLALLRGDSKKASELLAGRPTQASPLDRRTAQLARLDGRREEAVAASRRALDGSPTSLTLLEHVSSLLAAGKPDEAREIAEAHGALLGPLAPWLAVLADVEQARVPRAKARAATLPEPPQESPLALRIAVTRAMVAIGDRARGRALLDALRRQAPRHPEIAQLPARL